MSKRLSLITFLSTVLSLGCWVVMFLAGTDVWHDTGRQDFWRLDGPPYADLRAFATAFYLLLAVLIGSLSLQFATMLKRCGTRTV
jgi:hypothetical protein